MLLDRGTAVFLERRIPSNSVFLLAMRWWIHAQRTISTFHIGGEKVPIGLMIFQYVGHLQRFLSLIKPCTCLVLFSEAIILKLDGSLIRLNRLLIIDATSENRLRQASVWFGDRLDRELTLTYLGFLRAPDRVKWLNYLDILYRLGALLLIDFRAAGDDPVRGEDERVIGLVVAVEKPG